MRYPIAKPYIGEAEEKAVLRVLRSGTLSLGPVLKKFENSFAKKIGTKYACAVSSGTAGLHLAMIAAGIKAGDEVITSPFSFVASANVILYVGAKPVFVDIDPITLNIDPDRVRKVITRKTKALLPVHMFGQSAAMDPLMRIAREYKLTVIEDACESLLATYKGITVGTFGESAVFAFYPNKQITTGEGGMIVTDSKKHYELFSSLRNQGRSKHMQWLNHTALGYNYRLDEMSAAVGLAQLKRLPFLIRERIRLANIYSKLLTPHNIIVDTPQIGLHNKSTWFVYVIRIKDRKVKRDVVIEQMEKYGIATKPYVPSIHLFNFYKKRFGYKKGDFPVSERMSDTSLALPFYIGLSEKDIKYICQTLLTVLYTYEKGISK